eukprot:CAMPEP_0114261212 /NCGR_PEP_ID=MMETSP0058-20121206/20990_1 /TAXON_ID=36894 /ORGANISM="Pyramimonas parkeae, CCMP726" /LENGTH=351 /DNA_ID=CAMNT_0001376679 /DNA_START=178 /DNA_END=1230 /DNA_ORIENTATION=+
MNSPSVCRQAHRNYIQITPRKRPHKRSKRQKCFAKADGQRDEELWYFAYGADSNRFALERMGVKPFEVLAAAAVNNRVEFNATGLSKDFEPVFANLTSEPQALAYGSLVRIPRISLPRLRKGDRLDDGAERRETTVRVVSYDGRKLDATTHVTPKVSAVKALPSSRLLEVMIEAARLLGHEPRHIHELESLDVLNLPNSALLPTAPVNAVFLTPTQIAEANAVDGAPGYMAVGGFVFDITDPASNMFDSIFCGHQTAGSDATALFLEQLYVADLPSSNPDHWPRAPTALTPADLLDNVMTGQSTKDFGGTRPLSPLDPLSSAVSALVIPHEVLDSSNGQLGSRQLDVLAGW